MTSLFHFFNTKIIFGVFFVVFLLISLKVMIYVPFHDFDEAHRAENAKRMKEYKSYFVPLTGSSFDRVDHLKIPFKENPDLHLYYHLERPPLIYDLMIISSSVFGSSEWAYRLPSFILGISIFAVFILFIQKEKEKNVFASFVGLLFLITSSDIWLSSQYAQMDTGITLFLFLSLLTLLLFCKSRKTYLIFLSGVFLGLSLLSKLQPTVIFLFPLTYLFFIKKLSFRDLLKFFLGVLLIFLPWVLYLALKFGVVDVVNVMPGFALTSASIIDIHHQAPLFWYFRWWWSALRPGWVIFLAFVFYELRGGDLDFRKKTLLVYLFGGFLAFTIPINKLWWYVLPLIPAAGYYVFLVASDYLKKFPNRLTNLSFAILVGSIPLFLRSSNTLAVFYGIFITIVVFLILTDKINIKIDLGLSRKNVFNVAVIISLLAFLQHFPKIIPYHWNTKLVAEYYKNLPYPKCLWLGDMPGEAVLFYSNAGEVPLLNQTSQIYSTCPNNFLITPDRSRDGKLLIKQGTIRLYQLTQDHNRVSN